MAGMAGMTRGTAMVLAAVDDGFSLLDVFWSMLLFFVFVVWFWLLIMIFGDLFRRDTSGVAKVCWTVFLIVFPYLGVLVYLLTQGRGMAERRQDEAAAEQRRFEHEVRSIAGHGGPAAQPVEQIAAAKQLLDSGAISREEYEALKQKALGTAPSQTAPAGAAPASIPAPSGPPSSASNAASSASNAASSTSGR